MKHLFRAWRSAGNFINHGPLQLFIDYDGTLAPIADTPSLALMPAPTRAALEELSKQKDVDVCIVTGRLASEAAQLVGIKSFNYIGNHGYEITGPGLRQVHPGAAAASRTMDEIRGHLEGRLKKIENVVVENKLLTLSVHYRLARPDGVKEARKVCLEVLRPYIRRGEVVFRKGKKVWEIRPGTEWDKGSAVLWILAKSVSRSGRPVLPVYLGDDWTDEDAFKALADKGLTVKITKKPDERSAAHFYLKSTDEVREFLLRLIKRRGERNGKP